MFKIAFCDDDPSALQDISLLLDRYRQERNREIEYVSYRSPLDLMAQIEKGSRYDVLILDVLMPGENGIDTAAEIRNYDSNVKIIFLSSSSEYAVQSYTVNAFYYLLKPMRTENFFQLMDTVLSKCDDEKTKSILLRCKNGITRIEPKRLEYCEVIHRTLYIHLISGSVLESIGSLEELCNQLEGFGCFMRPHRSYVINLDYVRQLSYRAILMSCSAEIPLPRGKYQEIKDAYLKYAFESGQVMV